jgi:tetratricopeptide (TPR) repeat protein
MTNPSVFISYSHDSPEHEDRVLELSDRLRADGIEATIDQYQTAPPQGWPLWMEKEIRDSQFVLLVCTETYLKRVMKEDPGKGLGVMWESAIIYQYLYNAGVVNEKFIPIILGNENTKYIPMPLQPTTYYDVSTERGYEELCRRLTNQPHTKKPELGKLKALPPRERKSDFPSVKVSTAKLPSTDPTLFGRDDRLKQLDDTWNNPDINIVTLVAWGGVGKTALVNKWLLQMAKDNFRGAERVYGWSFYSQGAAEGRQVSADQFIAAVLEWCGDPDVTKGSPWDKGERLAELIKQQKTLLILDGLEPLQNPPPVETGRIKDPGLTSLLRELARQNPGLVMITTRLKVDDLKDFKNTTVIDIDLETLSEDAGADYLKHLGADGTNEQRKDASRDFGGHALALTLLGRYLKVVYGGDVRKRAEIPHVLDERKQGAHALRVMESYEHWLEGKPELDILRLMGLFDRPAEKGALDALRAEPVIEGLTDSLQHLGNANWQYTINSLRDLRLLAEADPNEPETLDCHPLLREYFGEKLKAGKLEAWKKGHSRLFEYYSLSAKVLPNTIEEMTPLYAAVMHGCQAGRYQETFHHVFWRRIQRGNDVFNAKKLGAAGSELSLLSGFFVLPWHQTVALLDEDSRGYVLNHVGYNLRALGRLMEAVEPMRAALELRIAQKSWHNAARTAMNLSESYLYMGHIVQALDYARESIEFADRSNDWVVQTICPTVLGNVLIQKGDLAEARKAFSKAEEIQKQNQAEFPILYSLRGFQYCDLLLILGDFQEVEARASQTLEWTVTNIHNQGSTSGLLDIALDNLSLGCAHLLKSQGQSHYMFTQSIYYLNRAVDGLREAGTQHYIPRGLLARAEFYVVTDTLDKAQKDLDEAFSIATRGGMRLYQADCHLAFARLYLAKGDNAKAHEHWKTAKRMIEEMGYHRRDKEVEELEEQLET